MAQLHLSIRARIYLAAITTLASVATFLFYHIYSQQQLQIVIQEILESRLNTMRTAEHIKQSLIAYDNILFRYIATMEDTHLHEGKQTKKTIGREINHLYSM